MMCIEFVGLAKPAPCVCRGMAAHWLCVHGGLATQNVEARPSPAAPGPVYRRRAGAKPPGDLGCTLDTRVMRIMSRDVFRGLAQTRLWHYGCAMARSIYGCTTPALRLHDPAVLRPGSPAQLRYGWATAALRLHYYDRTTAALLPHHGMTSVPLPKTRHPSQLLSAHAQAK